jgi:histidyl-tRNA synthetase
MSEEETKSDCEGRLLKGAADSPPERQIRREKVIGVIRETFEVFGFNPMETPILNRFDTLAHKYQEGDPILDEIFHATDRGKRELGLRYDLTQPLCRFVSEALKGHFALPFKRYEIGKVYRDGPIKEGRLREFVQCDADVIGSSDPASDAECLALYGLVFQRLGIDAEIELNNRKILWGILDEAGLDGARREAATVIIDKWDKVGAEGIRKELVEAGLADTEIQRIFANMEIGAKGEEGLRALETGEMKDNALFLEGLAELRAVLNAVEDVGVSIPIKLTPRLARGLGIYTGTIYEVFLRDRKKMSSALGAGGRYDRAVGEFLHPGEPDLQGNYPSVGMTFGIEPICVVLDKFNKGESGPKTVVEVLVVPMGTRSESLRLASQLRARGVKTEIDLSGDRMKKIFKRANNSGIPYIMVLGEDELAAGEVTLKDMESGEQSRLPLDRAAEETALRCGIAPQ